MQKQTDTLPVVLWLLSGIFLVAAMVVIDGITRLTGSGLSIVKCNLLSGTFPPLSEADWMLTFEKYKQFPEYQKLRSGMTLAGFKEIFWWEFLHRLLGRFIGMVFILPFLYFLFRKKLSGWLIIRLLFILLLTAIAQGLMGWIMVKSGLSDMPHVSHYRLAAHLTLALLLVGVILWTVADILAPARKQRYATTQLKGMAWLVLFLVLLQIILGAFVAGLNSGFSYNTYPLMEGEMFPSHLSSYITWHNVLDNGVAVQFLHRWFAMLVMGLIVLFWYKARHSKLATSTQRIILLLLLTGIAQVGLGIATLLLAVPLTLGVLHQLVAVVLLALGILAVHQLQTGIPLARKEKSKPVLTKRLNHYYQKETE